MQTKLYVRVQGKVIGPLGLDQLRGLRDRGQFRQFHEVSADRQSWVAASTIVELFPSSTASAQAPISPAAPGPSQAPPAVATAAKAGARRPGRRASRAVIATAVIVLIGAG